MASSRQRPREVGEEIFAPGFGGEGGEILFFDSLNTRKLALLNVFFFGWGGGKGIFD